MHDAVTAIQYATAMTGQIIDAIGADDLNRPTVCSQWTVRHVVNHIVGGMRLYSAELTGTTAGGEHEDDWLGDDITGAYRDAATEVLHAWRSPGAEQRVINLSFGAVPAPMAAVVELTEILVHGADVAVAIGQEHLVDQEQCRALLQTMTAMGIDQFRAPGIFGSQQSAEPEAPAHRQLLAFLGRDLLVADALRPSGTGPGGHPGNDTNSSATAFHPVTGSSEKSLPDPSGESLGRQRLATTPAQSATR